MCPVHPTVGSKGIDTAVYKVKISFINFEHIWGEKVIRQSDSG